MNFDNNKDINAPPIPHIEQKIANLA